MLFEIGNSLFAIPFNLHCYIVCTSVHIVKKKNKLRELIKKKGMPMVADQMGPVLDPCPFAFRRPFTYFLKI